MGGPGVFPGEDGPVGLVLVVHRVPPTHIGWTWWGLAGSSRGAGLLSALIRGHSSSRSNRAIAAVSSRVITHKPTTCGSSTMVPSCLLTIKFVNPAAPCCVQVTAMARELLPCAATDC